MKRPYTDCRFCSLLNKAQGLYIESQHLAAYIIGRGENEMTSDNTVTLPPSPPNFIILALNKMISRILRSPLHGVLSKSTLVLSFRGAKSGKQFTFPVGYYDLQGKNLFVIPLHRWWTNLRGNVPVTIWLKGRKYQGVADASQGDERTVQELQRLIGASANLIRLYKIPHNAQGQLDHDRLSQVAHALPLVRIRLDG